LTFEPFGFKRTRWCSFTRNAPYALNPRFYYLTFIILSWPH